MAFVYGGHTVMPGLTSWCASYVARNLSRVGQVRRLRETGTTVAGSVAHPHPPPLSVALLYLGGGGARM